jgi:hypothetical protein
VLGHVDDAHASFADLLEQLVGADLCARFLLRRLINSRCDANSRRRTFQKARAVVVGPQERLDSLDGGQVCTTNLGQVGLTSRGRTDFARDFKYRLVIKCFYSHFPTPGTR